MSGLTHTQKEALSKLMKFCAYQERCYKEAEKKLSDLGLFGEEAGEVLMELSAAGFLDEERFAKAFVRGKFRFKHWGRKKILIELRQRQISDYNIQKGFEEIDDEVYLDTLKWLAEKHLTKLKSEKNVWVKRKKTGSYLMSKGYEPELVNEVLMELTQV